jgi:hypothetical protein
MAEMYVQGGSTHLVSAILMEIDEIWRINRKYLSFENEGKTLPSLPS